MKLINITLFSITILVNSCYSQKKDQESSCSRSNLQELHQASEYNEIGSVFYYDENCKVDSLRLEFKLDDRSFTNSKNFKLENLLIKLGYIGEDTSHFSEQIVLDKFIFSKKNLNVIAKFPLTDTRLDSINYLVVETVGVEEGRMSISNLYSYNNSLFLVGKQNTYLDHKAFLKTNVVYNIISTKNNIINKISLTVKTTNIDALTAYNVVVNGIELNFKYSVNASFNNFKIEDKGCVLENVLKMNGNYLELKLDVSKLNIKKIDKVEANLY